MPTSYTSLLGLALPVTGELSGTWGDTVNQYITQYLDSAVEGTQTISGSQTSVTLSVTNGTSLSQVGSGSTGSAQYAIINCTGNPASTLTITAPASSRQYLVLNSTSTSQSVIFRGAGPTTGVTLVSGERCIVAWNGSDFVKVATSTADGVTTFSAGTTGFTPSSATSGAVTLAGTLATTNGGTGLTSFTANGVVYASSTSALTTGSALTFDGTNFGVGTASPSYKLEVSSVISSVNGSVRGLFYSDTSKLILDTTGSAPISFAVNGTEQMRLTSTGLGIGTSSPAQKLEVAGNILINTSGNPFAEIKTSGAGNNPYLKLTAASNSWTVQGTFSNANDDLLVLYNSTTLLDLDNAGNLGLGVTPSAWSSSVASQVGYGAALSSRSAGNTASDMTHGAYWNGTNWLYQYSSVGAARYQMTGANGGSTHAWFVSAGGTAGNAISFTQAMTLDANGNLGLGTTTPRNVSGYENLTIDGSTSGLLDINTNGTRVFSLYGAGNDINLVNPTATGTMQFYTNNTSKLTITAAGFTRPVAYADTVSALGNTGTATTINLQNANVFTATLTGNCTFTLSNPIATGSSSFTLILTNDGTAGRTVAWAGGAFRFPGGAASLSRTTTANATDIWVFFTPDGGTTWYGNIAMKNMAA